MKKAIIVSFLSVFIFCACPNQKEMSFQKIEYNAYTRGSSTKIIVEKGIATLFKNGKETIQKNLTKTDYRKIYDATKSLDLSNLETLKAPSDRHRFDGAMSTTIKITDSKGKTYSSLTFDHDNPPAELKDLIAYLQSL